MSQGYVDSSLRRNVYGYRIDDTTVSNSRNVFRGRRVLYGADEDLYGVLVGLDANQLKGVADNADCLGFATPSNPWTHHVVDEPFHHVDRGFPETLVLVSTASMRK